MEVAGYTEDFFKSYYRNVLASERYEAWLVRNDPEITQEEIEAAYRQRTDESKSLYAQDIPAFETAAGKRRGNLVSSCGLSRSAADYAECAGRNRR